MKISYKQDMFSTLIICEDYDDLDEVIDFKENKLEPTMNKWKYLRCLGFKLDGVGTNNTLKQLPNILTPTYRIVYMLANCEFGLKDNLSDEGRGGSQLFDKLLEPQFYTISSAQGKVITLDDIKERMSKKKINFRCKEYSEFNIISLNKFLDIDLFMLITSQEDWEVQQYELSCLEDIFLLKRPYEPSFQIIIGEGKRTFRTRYRIENLEEMKQFWEN